MNVNRYKIFIYKLILRENLKLKLIIVITDY